MKDAVEFSQRVSDTSGFAFSAVSAIALFAAQCAFATNYDFTGQVNNNWGTAKNWYTEGSSGTAQTSLPPSTGNHNLNFRGNASNIKSSFKSDPTVNIKGSYTNAWKVHVRNLGTESAPVVFKADTDARGVTVGNTTAGNNTGYYIAYDGGTAWLRLEKGTYKTASGGHWFIGGTNYQAHVVAESGVAVSASQNLNICNGTFDSNGATVSGKVVNLGGYGNGVLGAPNTHAIVRVNGGTMSSSANTEIGLFSGSTTGGYALLSVSGGAVYTATGNLQMGAANGIQHDQAWLAVTNGTMNVNNTVYINGGEGGIAIGDGGSVTVASANGLCVADGGRGYANVGGDFKISIGEGGVLAAQTIQRRANKTSPQHVNVAFEGGTLKATADTASLVADNSQITVTVAAAGGTIDANGKTVTIPADIGEDPSSTGGGLTFTGGGTVTLSGDVSYNGKTTLANGTALAVTQTAAKTKILSNGLVVAIPEGGIAVGTAVLTLQSGDTISASELAASSFKGTGAADYAFEVSADGKSVVVVRNNSSKVLTWNGGASGDWSGTGLWLDANNAANTWANGDEAVFATVGDKATLTADATAKSLTFQASATVDGTGTLSVPTVSVAPAASSTISAPTAGALEKTGAGVLSLGASRTEQTTVSEGTLKMASGATVDPAGLALGTDAAKSVTFDYGGQTLSAGSVGYLGAGMNVTLTNGTFVASAADVNFNASTAPSVLTIAKGATLKTTQRYVWNASTNLNVDSSTTVNIAGGQMVSESNNNWFMNGSQRGTLSINVTDHGLLQLGGGQAYIMTCRGVTTAEATPEMRMTFNDSTFSIPGNYNLRFGYDADNKNPLEPKFALAMTNSVLDVGAGIIYLGHNVLTNANKAGFYTADIVNSVVTTKQFSVWADRPLNKANFDGATIVAADAGDSTLAVQSGAAGMTVGAGGLTIDTQAFDCGLKADLVGTGAVTKRGAGTLTVHTAQTGTGTMNVTEGTLALGEGVAMTRGLSLAANTTLVLGSIGTNTAVFTGSSFTFAPGTTVILPASLTKGENKLFTLTEGTFAADAAANLSVRCAVPCSLAVRGDTIYASIAHDYTILNGTTKTAPVIRGDEHVIGAGGLNIANLELPATAKLTYDPVKTPIYVWTQLTINEGFTFALSENYAGTTCGRIVLVTFKGTGVTGLPETAEGLNALFDASTIASGAQYAVTIEPAPAQDNVGRQQLVLTVGDYAHAPEIRILPIGDSITQGVTRDDQGDYPQYRTSIAARLAASGYRPKMKGVWKFAPYNAAHVEEPDDWVWHCGISGDRIRTAPYINDETDKRGGVRDNLHLYLDIAGYTDVITLLIGTNDVGSGGEAGAVGYANFKTLLLDMAAKRPDAKIVVSTLLQRNGEGNAMYQRVVDFNNLLKADVAAGNVYPSNVILLDLFEQIPLAGEGNFFSDKLHMNWAGCSIAAEAFAGKIMEALPLPAFTGTTDATVTDVAQTALGAAETVPAEYRAGMTHVFTIDATNAVNKFGASSVAPYTATNTAVSLARQVTKVGYYMELVRAGTSRRRYVWVDFDATGKTLDQLDFPWTGDNIQFIAEKLHVYSNDSGITNVAANVDSVKGIIEGTHFNYTAADGLAGAPADIMTDGWNDTLGTSGSYGCFQAHRIFSQNEGDTHWNNAQVLFAWNRWGNSDDPDQIGIGDYACHASGVGNTMDYTFTTEKGTDGLPDTVGAGAYQVRHLEIWAIPVIPQNAKHGKWIGGAGPEMSTAANWEDNTVPVAGDALDFSGVTSATTINADIDAAFGAVANGTGVITFNGNLAAKSFTDTSRIAVGENATVTVRGDLTFSGSATQRVVYRVASGGIFAVAGSIILAGSSYLLPFVDNTSEGVISASGLVDVSSNSEAAPFRIGVGNQSSDYGKGGNWLIGSTGLTGSKGFWLQPHSNDVTTVTASADFGILMPVGVYAPASLNLDTAGHTITVRGVGGGFYRNGTVCIKGSGTVVCDFDVTSISGAQAGQLACPYSVENAATLAIKPGANLGTGAISVASNATLQVAQSGEVALSGGLALVDGAILGFNLTDNEVLPVLDTAGKSVTFGSESNVVVKVSVAQGKSAMSGTNVLTKGGAFRGVNVSLAEGSPVWATRVWINDDGNIVLGTEFKGMRVIVR